MDETEPRRLAFIFDIDGTLADNRHRQRYLYQANKTKAECWKDFFDKSGEDPLYKDTVLLATRLSLAGFVILFVTGRSKAYHEMTKTWLEDAMREPIFDSQIFERKVKDFRKDWEVKRDIYETCIEPKYRVLGVFEDNLACVKMWRARGLTCYQPREEIIL